MTETLKPCPLCHSIDVYMTRNPSGLPHSVICRKCGCDAPWISWNTRAPDDVAQIVAWLNREGLKLVAQHKKRRNPFSFAWLRRAGAFGLAAQLIERGDWKDKDDG